MKKIVKLTESDLTRLVKRIVEEEEWSLSLRRRFGLMEDSYILGLIKKAKKETKVRDFNDYSEYVENVVYWVVQELQSTYGDEDDFWYDNEDEISDYIMEKYDDYLY